MRFPVSLLKRSGGFLPWRKGRVSRSLMRGAGHLRFIVAISVGFGFVFWPDADPLEFCLFQTPSSFGDEGGCLHIIEAYEISGSYLEP